MDEMKTSSATKEDLKDSKDELKAEIVELKQRIIERLSYVGIYTLYD